MKRFALAPAALAVLALTHTPAAAERIKFDYWYGLTGDLGEVMVISPHRVAQIEC